MAVAVAGTEGFRQITFMDAIVQAQIEEIDRIVLNKN